MIIADTGNQTQWLDNLPWLIGVNIAAIQAGADVLVGDKTCEHTTECRVRIDIPSLPTATEHQSKLIGFIPDLLKFSRIKSETAVEIQIERRAGRGRLHFSNDSSGLTQEKEVWLRIMISEGVIQTRDQK